MLSDQTEYDIRCEWGEKGVEQLAPRSDVVIIVDILSFSTCVDIACSRGAVVYPYRWKDVVSSKSFANTVRAELAGGRESGSSYSLSPASLLDIPPLTRLVLPSPNGSNLTLSTGDTVTMTGCLRNCRAVAEAARKRGKTIAVIPAGERWKDDHSLRPAIEDLIGAGAIIHYLGGPRSPEAQVAEAAFIGVKDDLFSVLRQSVSGRELGDKGFETDIELAAALNSSPFAPVFDGSAYSANQPKK